MAAHGHRQQEGSENHDGTNLSVLLQSVMRLLVALLILLGLASPAHAEALVRIEGKNFIEPNGRILRLKGISLGNWLMPEGYMFKFEVAKSRARSTAPSIACWDRSVPQRSGGSIATPM